MYKTQFSLNAIPIECNSHCIKMCHSIEPRDRKYVKGYRSLSFAINIGNNISNKYSQKLVDTAKKSTTDAIKTASERAIQKATSDIIDNKLADKITSTSKKSSKEFRSKELHSKMKLIMKYQKEDIYL